MSRLAESRRPASCSRRIRTATPSSRCEGRSATNGHDGDGFTRRDGPSVPVLPDWRYERNSRRKMSRVVVGSAAAIRCCRKGRSPSGKGADRPKGHPRRQDLRRRRSLIRQSVSRCTSATHCRIRLRPGQRRRRMGPRLHVFRRTLAITSDSTEATRPVHLPTAREESHSG